MTITAIEFRIVAKPFGYPMYAAPGVPGVGWSDQEQEAAVYVVGEDNPDAKLKYWRAQLAGHGLDSSTVEVEYL